MLPLCGQARAVPSQAVRRTARALHELTEHAVPLHPQQLRHLLALMARLSLRRHGANLLEVAVQRLFSNLRRHYPAVDLEVITALEAEDD